MRLPEPPQGRIAFRNVHFVYPSRPGVSALNGASFEVEPGETVAIVGPSGAGKSTIFNLILRFYDVQSGVVAVDGIAVADVDPAALRARIAQVPQDVALFDETVAENIRYGRPEASDRDIESAAGAGSACRGASASASRSPAPSCATRRSCCSTRRPARSMPRASGRCRRPCSASRRTAPRW